MDEHKDIINMFPQCIKNYICNVKDPLDYPQIIINIVKDKNIKLIFKKKIDDFGEIEYDTLFCIKDILKLINISFQHIFNWKKWIYIDEYVYYSDIRLHTELYIFSFDIKKNIINSDIIFINIEGLKKIFINIDIPRIHTHKIWLYNLDLTMKKIVKYIYYVKKNQEIEKYKIENNILKEKINNNKCKENKLIENALINYPNNIKKNGKIYILSTEYLEQNCIYIISSIFDNNYNHLYERKVINDNVYENIIHNMLYFIKKTTKDTKYNFYYFRSLLDGIKVINDIIDFIDKMNNKYNNIEDFRNLFINGQIKSINIINETISEYIDDDNNTEFIDYDSDDNNYIKISLKDLYE